MRYTLTFTEEAFGLLRSIVLSVPDCEGAAYLLCGRSVTAQETRLLVREVMPVDDAHYLAREPLRLSIDSASYARAAKRALATGASVVFVHSHPGGIAHFSQQDDSQEPFLMEFLGARIPAVPHGSLVLNEVPSVRARMWINEGWEDMEVVRVVGRRIWLYASGTREAIPTFFDRQVRAFGPEIQQLLGRMHVGVVGAGGTGSAVIEQLVRLGIGKLTIFEGDTLEDTNVTRVYGSTLADCGQKKAEVSAKHGKRIGLGTEIEVVGKHITFASSAARLRDCDVIFGCTDKQKPRAILTQLSIRYLIPFIDMGVKIDSKDGVIGGIYGRVTTLMAGEACLFCRGRLDPQRIALESMTKVQRKALADEGYAPELDTTDPAVITFTTAVAAQAVAELLHRLTGFMGKERHTTEVLFRFHETALGKNRQASNPDCLCSNRELWGVGDTEDLLGLTWPEEG